MGCCASRSDAAGPDGAGAGSGLEAGLLAQEVVVIPADAEPPRKRELPLKSGAGEQVEDATGKLPLASAGGSKDACAQDIAEPHSATAADAVATPAEELHDAATGAGDALVDGDEDADQPALAGGAHAAAEPAGGSKGEPITFVGAGVALPSAGGDGISAEERQRQYFEQLRGQKQAQEDEERRRDEAKVAAMSPEERAAHEAGEQAKAKHEAKKEKLLTKHMEGYKAGGGAGGGGGRGRGRGRGGKRK